MQKDDGNGNMVDDASIKYLSECEREDSLSGLINSSCMISMVDNASIKYLSECA
jgi:hypothetical protein